VSGRLASEHRPATHLASFSSGTVSNLHRIATMWHLPELHQQISRRNADHIIELGSLAKLKGIVSSSQCKPASIVGAILNCSLPQDNTLHLTNWSKECLTEAEIEYAANDAYAAFLIWNALVMQPTVGLPVSVFHPGVLVDIRGGKKIIAKGQIVSQPQALTVQTAVGIKNIKVTSTRIVVQVDEILMPMFEPAFYKIPLQNLGSPPFMLLVSKSLLITCNETSPIVLSPTIDSQHGRTVPEDLLSYPPPVIQLPESCEEIHIESSDEDVSEDVDTEPSVSDGAEDHMISVTQEINAMEVCLHHPIFCNIC
jgi:hypothetical protein